MQAAAQLEVCPLLLSLPVKQQHRPGRRKENLAATTLAYMAVPLCSSIPTCLQHEYNAAVHTVSRAPWAEKGAGLVSNVGVGAVPAAVGATLRSQWFTCGPRTVSVQLTNGFYDDCQNCCSIPLQLGGALLMHNAFTD